MKSPLKTHGGKSYLAKEIVSMMPRHSRYLEAFSGGLSVLLAKSPEGISEYANDLNGELMNFWRVLRDTPSRMLQSLWGTPLSTEEFAKAKDVAYTDPVKRVPELVERLRRVEVWNVPAIDAIHKLDCDDLLVYADPPYLHETRSTTQEYGQFEMTEKDHRELLDCLASMKGKFLLSGYDSRLYRNYEELCGWNRRTFDLPNNASSAKTKERKSEIVWCNYS